MPNPENLKGHSFKDKPENINKKGRPKNIYSQIKRKGYSATDIKTAMREVSFYTYDELKKLYNDKKKPVILRIIANQYYKTLTKGDWHKIKEIMEHTLGKPLQEIKQDTTVHVKDPFKEIRDNLGIDETDPQTETSS